jgi:hypothetical protein
MAYGENKVMILHSFTNLGGTLRRPENKVLGSKFWFGSFRFTLHPNFSLEHFLEELYTAHHFSSNLPSKWPELGKLLGVSVKLGVSEGILSFSKVFDANLNYA